MKRLSVAYPPLHVAMHAVLYFIQSVGVVNIPAEWIFILHPKFPFKQILENSFHIELTCELAPDIPKVEKLKRSLSDFLRNRRNEWESRHKANGNYFVFSIEQAE